MLSDFSFFTKIDTAKLTRFQQAVYDGNQQEANENMVFRKVQLSRGQIVDLVTNTTALMLAARVSQINIGHQLLIETNYRNCFGVGAIHIALFFKQPEFVKLLLPLESQLTTSFLETNLMIAAHIDCLEFVTEFKHQAGRQSLNGVNAMMIAAKQNSINALHYMINEKLFECELQQVDKNEHNALFYALNNGSTAAALLLLNHQNITDFEMMWKLVVSGDLLNFCLFKNCLTNSDGQTILMLLCQHITSCCDIFGLILTHTRRSLAQEKQLFNFNQLEAKQELPYLVQNCVKFGQLDVLQIINNELLNSIDNCCMQQQQKLDYYGKTALLYLLQQKVSCSCPASHDFLENKLIDYRSLIKDIQSPLQVALFVQSHFIFNTQHDTVEQMNILLINSEVCPHCCTQLFSCLFYRLFSYLDKEILLTYEQNNMLDIFLCNQELIQVLDQEIISLILQNMLYNCLEPNLETMKIVLNSLKLYLEYVCMDDLVKVMKLFDQKLLIQQFLNVDVNCQLVAELCIQEAINVERIHIIESEKINSLLKQPIDQQSILFREVIQNTDLGIINYNLNQCTECTNLMIQMQENVFNTEDFQQIGFQVVSLKTTALIYHSIHGVDKYSDTQLSFIKKLCECENSTVDKDGHTALFYAIRHGNHTLIKLLLQYPLEFQYESGSRTVLMEACLQFVNTQIFSDIVDTCTTQIGLRCQFEQNKSALFYFCEAILLQHTACFEVELLQRFESELNFVLQDGADIFTYIVSFQIDNEHETHQLNLIKFTLITQLFLIKGENINNQGFSPLCLCLQQRNIQLAELFIYHSPLQSSFSAAHFAVQIKTTPIFVKELNQVDDEGNNLLIQCAKCDFLQGAQLVYSQCCLQAEQTNIFGQDALQISILSQSIQVFEYLFGELDLQDTNIESLLKLAIDVENLKVIQILIQQQQNIVIIEDSPLIYCMLHKKFKAAKALLDLTKLSKTANINLKLGKLKAQMSFKVCNSTVTSGCKPNFQLQTSKGYSALMLAVLYGQVEIAALLIEQDQRLITELDKTALMCILDIEPNLKVSPQIKHQLVELLLPYESCIANSQGLTFFHQLMQQNNSDLFPQTYKIVAQYELRCNDGKGFNAIARAVMLGNLFALNQLFQQELPFYTPVITDLDETSLMLAARLGDVDATKILLKFESGIRQKDGTTALMVAAKYRQLQCIEILANVEMGLTKNGGLTALMIAAGDIQQIQVLRFLVDYSLTSGKSEIQCQSDSGKTALSFATLSCNIDAVDLLAPYEAGTLDRNTGDSSLMIAVRKNHTQIVKILAQSHDINMINSKTTQTSLMIAAEYCHQDCCQFLRYEQGIPMYDDTSALILAVYSNSLVIVQLLAEKEQKRMTKSQYIIHGIQLPRFDSLAKAIQGKETIIRKLEKPDKQQKSQIIYVEGFKSALMIASELGRLEIAQYLSQFEVGLINPANGWKAIHYAAMNGHKKVIQLLMKSKLENTDDSFIKTAKRFGMQAFV